MMYLKPFSGEPCRTLFCAVIFAAMLALSGAAFAQPNPGAMAMWPNHGPMAGGGTVTIYGQYVGQTTGVTFAGTPATSMTVTGVSGLTAGIPPGITPGRAAVTLVHPGGTVDVPGGYIYEGGPAVVLSGVLPDHGPLAGGITVEVYGSGFVSTANITSVGFHITAPGMSTVVRNATGIAVLSDTLLTCDLPPGIYGGSVNVVVTTQGLAVTTLASAFIYDGPTTTPAPLIASVSPSSGTVAGNTFVTITGQNFTGVSEVHFGAMLAPSFVFVNATQIDVLSPAAAVGTVMVSVTTAGGTGMLPGAFTYIIPPPAPSVSYVLPGTGPLSGGGIVMITGSDFTGATAVTFGGIAATGVAVVTADALSCVLPAAAAAGPVDVAVTTPGGTGTLPGGFLYDAVTPPTLPALVAVTPASGPLGGGSAVTLTGQLFTGVNDVHFGGIPAASFTFVNDTRIDAVTPAGVTPATVEVMVLTPAGVALLPSAWTWTANGNAPPPLPAAAPASSLGGGGAGGCAAQGMPHGEGAVTLFVLLALLAALRHARHVFRDRL